jgi:hypothetical protein
MNGAPGQEEVLFCALSLLTMTSLRNPWVLGERRQDDALEQNSMATQARAPLPRSLL